MTVDPSPAPWTSIHSSGAVCTRLSTDIYRPYRSGETLAVVLFFPTRLGYNPESSSAWWDGGGSARRAGCPFPAKSCASHRAACMLKEEAIINFAELVSERLVLFSGAWRFGPRRAALAVVFPRKTLYSFVRRPAPPGIRRRFCRSAE